MFFFFASCSVSLQNCSNHLFYFRSLFCVTQRNNIFFCSMVPNFEAALKWLKALVINWNVNQSTVIIVICLPKKAEALFIFSSWHLEYNGLSIKWLPKVNQRSNWLSFVRIDRFAPNILWTAEAAKQAFSYRGAVMWNGLENVLKDEINLNSFKSALSLPWTRDCLEGVERELMLVI